MSIGITLQKTFILGYYVAIIPYGVNLRNCPHISAICVYRKHSAIPNIEFYKSITHTYVLFITSLKYSLQIPFVIAHLWLL